MAVSLKVNGAMRSVPAEPDTPLLYVLRNDLALNGAKFGCGLAQCGACTVLVDGRPVRSCVTEIGTLGQSEVTTLEGLGTVAKPHPIQQAFRECHALQCGFCTPGMVMNILGRFEEPEPLDLSDEGVRYLLSGNLCRCTGYVNIIAAVRRAAALLGRD